MAMTPPIQKLFNATIEENIRYGAASSVTAEELETAARAAQVLLLVLLLDGAHGVQCSIVVACYPSLSLRSAGA